VFYPSAEVFACGNRVDRGRGEDVVVALETEDLASGVETDVSVQVWGPVGVPVPVDACASNQSIGRQE